MNQIEIPYMPVDRFDPSKIIEKFAKTTEEEGKELINISPSLENSDGKELCDNLVLILHGMGMEKYIELFKKEKILLETFLQLNESDLKEIGITDENDRKFIVKNLAFHVTNRNEFAISENHIEDLQIVKNLSHQILLLQNYCAYLQLQMKKQKLTDFRINAEESACTYLKAFSESALIQSQILSCRIYDVNGSEAIIDKLLKAYNLTLPKAMLELLPKKKKKSNVLKIIIIIGFSSFVIITGKYLIKRW